MSYTPTNWANGDVITTEKLNKIESGIVAANSGGGVLVVNDVNGTLDKTAGEIMAAAETTGAIIKADKSMGGRVAIQYYPIVEYNHFVSTFSFSTYNAEYSAHEEADYPVNAE